MRFPRRSFAALAATALVSITSLAGATSALADTTPTPAPVGIGTAQVVGSPCDSANVWADAYANEQHHLVGVISTGAFALGVASNQTQEDFGIKLRTIQTRWDVAQWWPTDAHTKILSVDTIKLNAAGWAVVRTFNGQRHSFGAAPNEKFVYVGICAYNDTLPSGPID